MYKRRGPFAIIESGDRRIRTVWLLSGIICYYVVLSADDVHGEGTQTYLSLD